MPGTSGVNISADIVLFLSTMATVITY